jgi:hypothetical protein
VPLVGTEFNEFEQYVLTYKNFDLFGGSFSADAYTPTRRCASRPTTAPTARIR